MPSRIGNPDECVYGIRGFGHLEFLLVFACHTLSFFHCQEPKYFALHRFALYSLSRVFVEAQVLRGIPYACLEAADRWEALNLTEQTQGRTDDWARVLWVYSRCHWRILSIRFSDITTETCSLTLPAVLFLLQRHGQSQETAIKGNPLACPGCCSRIQVMQFIRKPPWHFTIPEYLQPIVPAELYSFCNTLTLIHEHTGHKRHITQLQQQPCHRSLLSSNGWIRKREQLLYFMWQSRVTWAKIHSEPKESSGQWTCL